MNWRTKTPFKNIYVQIVEKGLSNSLYYLSYFVVDILFVLMYFCFIILGNFNYFRYNALDALRLISFEDEDFHCEHCNGKLEVESDKLAAQEGGDRDENARRLRREKLKDMLQKMEVLI